MRTKKLIKIRRLHGVISSVIKSTSTVQTVHCALSNDLTKSIPKILEKGIIWFHLSVGIPAHTRTKCMLSKLLSRLAINIIDLHYLSQ